MSSTAFGIDEGFRARHIGTDADAQAIMLNALGYESVEALVERAVPASREAPGPNWVWALVALVLCFPALVRVLLISGAVQ